MAAPCTGNLLTYIIVSSSWSHHYHHAVCPTTSPQPLPKPVPHTVRSSASFSNLQYLFIPLKSSSLCLCLLPRLPVTSIFLSVTCFRRQFLRKMWPIRLTFLIFMVCTMLFSFLTLGNILQHPSSWKTLFWGQQKMSVWSQWLISPSYVHLHLLTFSDFLFKTFRLLSCVMARDQVSYPYQMKIKTVVWKNQ